MKSAWPTRLKDFLEDCDVAVGGISVTLDQWPHLAKASGEYDRIAARWLR
ncbi:MAG: hypothetical protein ABI520_15325 [Caldimonas sp.]